jgi:putative ABC transport system permease protein
VIGRTIDLGRPVEIVGVTPPWFRGLSGDAELFLPIAIQTQREVGGPFAHQFNLVARRKPGVSARAAMAEVAVLGTRVAAAYPGGAKGGAAGWGAAARPLDDTRLAPSTRGALLVLFGAVTLVLLIACVNLANLLLGRASARRREVAIRLALGARRGRLVRLFLAESIVLALVGAVAATIVAWWGIALLRSIDSSVLTAARRGDTTAAVGLASIRLDAVTFSFLFAVTLVAGVVFGLSSAAGATRTSVTGALAGASKAGRRRFGGRRALVVAEVALAIVLLAGSGLMVRSLAKLLAVDPGFDARGVLTAFVSVPQGALARDSQPVFYGQLVERLAALPGVQAVGLTNCVPLTGICNFTRMTLREGPPVDPSVEPGVGVRWATPGYFAAMRVPLRRGRLFGDADRLGAPKVVLLSETAARRFWPHADPIGARVGIHQGGFADGAEVIGIVGDVRTEPDSAPKPDVYLPYAQSPQPGLVVFVRSSTGAAPLATPVRRAMRELAPEYPVFDIQTMAARVAAATARPRLAALVLGAFAAVALALATVGIYGVMSFVVGQRTREIGVRMALGARRGEVLRLVVAEGLALAGAGGVIGLAGAIAFTRVLDAMLFDVSPSDPATYAAIIALSALAALAASWLPARRATRVDPVVALRAE